MILLLILVNKKAKVVQSILEEKNQQQTLSSENVSLLGDSQLPSASSNNAGISIVKKTIAKSSSEKSFLASGQRKSVESVSAQSTATSSDTSAVESPKKAVDTTKNESANITKISKRPPAQEKQQMMDKGILMF